MADTQNIPTHIEVSSPPVVEVKPPKPRGPTRHQQLNKLYALPAPLRTFPLPIFVPHNPLSLFHILYVWASQAIKPQPSHFEPLYQGWFSPETRSVHVTDVRSIRGLWEQGFYGKGNLSRSEPSWLEREKTRRGDKARTTSEELTRRRRAERQQVKWERARKEREAIDQRLLEEAAAVLENEKVESMQEDVHVERIEDDFALPAADTVDESMPIPVIEASILEETQESGMSEDGHPEFKTPRVPDEPRTVVLNGVDNNLVLSTLQYPSPVGPLELLALPNSANDVILITEEVKEVSMPVPTRLGSHFVSQPRRFPSPVGPLELLSLPNSAIDSWLDTSSEIETVGYGHRYSCEVSVNSSPEIEAFIAPVGPVEILALPNSIAPITPPLELAESIETLVEEPEYETIQPRVHLPKNIEPLVPEPMHPATEPEPVKEVVGPDDIGNGSHFANGLGMNGDSKIGIQSLEIDSSDETANSSPHSETVDANGSASSITHPTTPGRKRQKSVRFSPTVEKNTFIQSEPPSPDRGVNTAVEEPLVIKQQEHTQLTLEEAFFLSFGLGALTILDPSTNSPISNKDLFTLFRQASYFPPRLDQATSPDGPFMLNYVVYHHYRSLGWVPRSGIKFSVDLMLYMRGPVFTHAEFGVIILPSYSDPYWNSSPSLQQYAKSKQQRTWAWMNCINRVISQVKKTLILTYVDIPKPLSAEEENELGIHGVLGRYKVREFVMKRWVANRSRD